MANFPDTPPRGDMTRKHGMDRLEKNLVANGLYIRPVPLNDTCHEWVILSLRLMTHMRPPNIKDRTKGNCRPLLCCFPKVKVGGYQMCLAHPWLLVSCGQFPIHVLMQCFHAQNISLACHKYPIAKPLGPNAYRLYQLFLSLLPRLQAWFFHLSF
jgi:hypothetical protein